MTRLPLPYVGKLVHYHPSPTATGMYPGEGVEAAMIVYVFEEENPQSPCTLTVFTPRGSEQRISRYGDGAGCWSWIVEPVGGEVF